MKINFNAKLSMVLTGLLIIVMIVMIVDNSMVLMIDSRFVVDYNLEIVTKVIRMVKMICYTPAVVLAIISTLFALLNKRWSTILSIALMSLAYLIFINASLSFKDMFLSESSVPDSMRLDYEVEAFSRGLEEHQYDSRSRFYDDLFDITND